MLHRRAAVVVLAAALSACNESLSTSHLSPASPSTSGPATVRVTGRVIDYSTDAGVAGQTVRWSSGSKGLDVRYGTLNIVTDAAGGFQIEVPVTADYEPLADRLAFELPEPAGTMSGVLRIPAKLTETTIYVHPGTCNVRYGYVYDAVSKQPIAGARVSRRNSATTDSNGFYRLNVICDAPPDQQFGIGTTTIGVSHPRYQGTYELDGRGEWTGRPGIRRVDFALQPLP